MKIKLERSSNKQKNKYTKWQSNFLKKLRFEKNNKHLLTNYNLYFIGSNQIQSNSKLAIQKELAKQQYNGLMYTNVAKLR